MMKKRQENYLLVTFQREVGWCNTSSGIVLPLFESLLEFSRARRIGALFRLRFIFFDEQIWVEPRRI